MNHLFYIRTLTLGVIEPWLVTSTIREPSVRATNSDVQDEVERPIERSAVRASKPWVLKDDLLAGSSVSDDGWEVSSLEEWFVEAEIERTMEPRVDVDPQKVGGPFKSVIMETLVEGLATLEPPAISLGNGVHERSGSPVE